MKRMIKASLMSFGLFSATTSAIVFNEVTMRSLSPENDAAMVSVFERNASSAWMVEVSTDSSEAKADYRMRLSAWSRPSGGLLVDSSPLASASLTTLLNLSEGEIPVFAGGVAGPNNGSWVMFDVQRCQVEQCDVIRTYRLFLSSTGMSTAMAGQQAVAEIPVPLCDVDPSSAFVLDDGVIFRHVGCGAMSRYDIAFNRDDTLGEGGLTQTLWGEDAQSSNIESVWRAGLGFGHLLTAKEGDNTHLTVYTQQQDGEKEVKQPKLTLSSSHTQCQLADIELTRVVCLTSEGEDTGGSGWHLEEGLTWRLEWEREHEKPVDAISVSHMPGHVFLFEHAEESITVVNQTPSGDVFTKREITTLAGITSAFDGLEFKGVVTQVSGNGNSVRYHLMMFDFLSTDQPPYFTNSLTGTIPTLFELDIDITAEDERTLPEDVKITLTQKPSWLAFDDQVNKLTGAPLNDDVGQWTLALSAEDGAGQVRALESELTVILTSAAIDIFEPTLFARLNLDAPFPFYNLTSQLPILQVLEDEVFEAVITIGNREGGEVSLTFAGLPEWLVFDPLSMTLSGTPLQEHVSISEVITVAVDDVYNQDADRYPDIIFQLEVIEVDEPFTVLSDGTATVEVGDTYVYQLAVSDEESVIEDFRVNPGLLPTWLSFDDTLKTLSGTPTERDTGRHLIQLVIQDEAGHTVVHSFDVRVISAKSGDVSGGSTSLLGLLGLMGLMMFRRFFVRA